MRVKRTKYHAVVMRQRSLLLGHQCDSEIFCNETDDGGIILCLVENARSEPGSATRLDQPRACPRIRLLRPLHKEHRFQTTERDSRIFRERISVVHGGQNRILAHAGAVKLNAVWVRSEIDEAEVNVVFFECPMLFSGIHFEEMQFRLRTLLAKRS